MSAYNANRSEPSRADRFIDLNCDIVLRDDEDLPLNTECPICLEGTEEHRCVRIVDVPGCNHLIGLSCVRHFLEDQPHRKKLCPICQTEWLPEEQRAGSAADRVAASLAMIEERERDFREMREGFARRRQENMDRVRQLREEYSEMRENLRRDLQEADELQAVAHQHAEQRIAEAQHRMEANNTAGENDPIHDEIDNTIRNIQRALDRGPDEFLGARARASSALTPFLPEPPRQMSFDERYVPGQSTRPRNYESARPRTPPLYSPIQRTTRPSHRFEPPRTQLGEASISGTSTLSRFLPPTESSPRPGSVFGPPHIETGTERSNRANHPSSMYYTDLPSFTGVGTVRVPRTHPPVGPGHRTSMSSARPPRHTQYFRGSVNVSPSSSPPSPTGRFNSGSGSSRRNTGVSANGERSLHTTIAFGEELQEIGAAMNELTQQFNAFAARYNQRPGSGA